MRKFLLILMQCLLYENTASKSTRVYDHNNLISHVNEQTYDIAVNIVKDLLKSKDYDPTMLASNIDFLLHTSIEKMLPFAYQLWEAGEKQFVMDYFPRAFKIAINQDNVSIVNYHYKMPLKLDVNTDKQGDRLVWGSDKKNETRRLIWTFNPVWEDNRVHFKIKNLERNMFIKLNYRPDGIGDRKVWGDNLNVPGKRLSWALKPQWKNGELVFHIINQEFGLVLKLSASKDIYKDRLVWGHNGDISEDPDRYLWQIFDEYSLTDISNN